MLNKAETSIWKELDLQKFIKRQRVTMYAALALLSGRQQFIVDKMSNMLIRESSDLDESTDEDMDINQRVPDTFNYGKKIFRSK